MKVRLDRNKVVYDGKAFKVVYSEEELNKKFSDLSSKIEEDHPMELKRCEHGVLEINNCYECLPYNFATQLGNQIQSKIDVLEKENAELKSKLEDAKHVLNKIASSSQEDYSECPWFAADCLGRIGG